MDAPTATTEEGGAEEPPALAVATAAAADAEPAAEPDAEPAAAEPAGGDSGDGAGSAEEPPASSTTLAAAADDAADAPAPAAEAAEAAGGSAAEDGGDAAISPPMSPFDNDSPVRPLGAGISKGDAPPREETTPEQDAANAAAAAASLAALEAEEAAKTLMFWLEAKISIPDVVEEVVLGEKAVKYKVNVNGEFHRAYDYREFIELRLGLQKKPEYKAKLAGLPPFPGKTMGTAGPKTVAERKLKLAAWLQAAVRLPEVVADELFADFVVQEVDYEKVEVELRKRVAELEEIPEEQWKLSCEKNGVQICTTKVDGSNYLLIRSKSMVRAPLEHVWAVYLDKAAWANWQPDMKVCKNVEVIKEGEADGTDFAEAFYVMYSVPVVSNRDVALYSNQLKGTYREPQNFDKRQITSRSIKHPKMGPTKKNVRGQCEVSRTVFTKVIRETKSGKKVETVELETMMHMNPKGSIPASVINMAVASATDSVAQMCTYMQQEWKVKAAAERTKPKQVAL